MSTLHFLSFQRKECYYMEKRKYGTDVLDRLNVKMPAKYNVIMFNDNTTYYDAVIFILVKIFQKTKNEAINIANEAQAAGKTVVGSYYKDIACTRVQLAMDFAQKNNFKDFKMTIEKGE